MLFDSIEFAVFFAHRIPVVLVRLLRKVELAVSGIARFTSLCCHVSGLLIEFGIGADGAVPCRPQRRVDGIVRGVSGSVRGRFSSTARCCGRLGNNDGPAESTGFFQADFQAWICLSALYGFRNLSRYEQLLCFRSYESFSDEGVFSDVFKDLERSDCDRLGEFLLSL